jgi:hypothetical protein
VIDKWGERITRWLVIVCAVYILVMVIVKWLVPYVLP